VFRPSRFVARSQIRRAVITGSVEGDIDKRHKGTGDEMQLNGEAGTISSKKVMIAGKHNPHQG
jgi:hypothetical protein